MDDAFFIVTNAWEFNFAISLKTELAKSIPGIDGTNEISRYS